MTPQTERVIFCARSVELSLTRHPLSEESAISPGSVYSYQPDQSSGTLINFFSLLNQI